MFISKRLQFDAKDLLVHYASLKGSISSLLAFSC